MEEKKMEDSLHHALEEELNLDELNSVEGGKESDQSPEQINAVANCATNNCNGGNCASGCGK